MNCNRQKKSAARAAFIFYRPLRLIVFGIRRKTADCNFIVADIDREIVCRHLTFHRNIFELAVQNIEVNGLICVSALSEWINELESITVFTVSERRICNRQFTIDGERCTFDHLNDETVFGFAGYESNEQCLKLDAVSCWSKLPEIEL